MEMRKYIFLESKKYIERKMLTWRKNIDVIAAGNISELRMMTLTTHLAPTAVQVTLGTFKLSL